MKYRSKGLFLLSLMMVSWHVLATDLDSLRSAIPRASESDKITLLIQIAQILEPQDSDSALDYLETALRLSKITENKSQEAHTLHLLANFHWMRGEFNESLEFEQKSLKRYSELQDTKGMANALMGIGVAYSEMCMHQPAIDHYLKASDLYSELGDTLSISYVHLNLGASFEEMSDSTSALKHYRTALTLTQGKGSPEDQADILQNIGNTLSNAGDDLQALKYYHKALELYRKNEHSPGLALCLANLAGSLNELDSIARAEVILTEAIERASHYNDFSTLCYAYNQMGSLLNRKRDYTRADGFLAKAWKLAKEKDYATELRDNLCYRSEWHHATGNHLQAYITQSQYIEFKDSLEKSNHLGTINNMSLVYETEQRDRQIKILQTEKERDALLVEKKNMAMAVSGILMLMITGAAGGVWQAYRKKRSLAEKLEAKQLELTRINAKLEEEKRHAEQAGKAKSEFLSMMTHELRTPLNAVVGIANLIDENNGNTLKKESVKTLKIASGNLLNLINNILDYNKADSGKFQFENLNFNLAKLLEDTLHPFMLEAAGKRIALNLQISEKLPEVICGDPARISQVLSNLIGNAIKFTDSGFVKLYAEECEDDAGNPMLRLVVKDTGIGIPRSKHQRIFESFSQAESSTTRKYGGTGLGLAICKQLIEAMGGKIRLESEAGVGASFNVELPLLPYLPDNGNLHNESDLEQRKQELREREVLVVDDNELNLYVASSILENLGINSRTARSGEEAINLIAHTTFDLVLMDVQMPGMDGYEAAGIMKEKLPHLPIVALSAGSKEEITTNDTSRVFSAIIRKPFEIDELVLVMHKALFAPIHEMD